MKRIIAALRLGRLLGALAALSSRGLHRHDGGCFRGAAENGVTSSASPATRSSWRPVRPNPGAAGNALPHPAQALFALMENCDAALALPASWHPGRSRPDVTHLLISAIRSPLSCWPWLAGDDDRFYHSFDGYVSEGQRNGFLCSDVEEAARLVIQNLV